MSSVQITQRTADYSTSHSETGALPIGLPESLRRPPRVPPVRLRRRHQEEPLNHERWAIPYGDLVTLLLAFFVVMYSISRVNQGKYRVLAQSLAHAFAGAPRVIEPIQAGRQPTQSPLISTLHSLQPAAPNGSALPKMMLAHDSAKAPISPGSGSAASGSQFAKLAEQVRKALAPLVQNGDITVHAKPYWLEVGIHTDLLFPSGVATLSPQAVPVIQRIAGILAPLPNALRIEGYTDNQPIHTAAFPSNWELSAARAATVARLFVDHGVDPRRLGVIGWSQYRPLASNGTPQGRNRNRRVEIIVLGGSELPKRFYNIAKDHAVPSRPTVVPAYPGSKP